MAATPRVTAAATKEAGTAMQIARRSLHRTARQAAALQPATAGARQAATRATPYDAASEIDDRRSQATVFGCRCSR